MDTIAISPVAQIQADYNALVTSLIRTGESNRIMDIRFRLTFQDTQETMVASNLILGEEDIAARNFTDYDHLSLDAYTEQMDVVLELHPYFGHQRITTSASYFNYGHITVGVFLV